MDTSRADAGPFTYRPIGIIRSPHARAEETPAQPVFAEGIAGRVEIQPEYEAGLRDLDGFSHVYLVYPFDRADPPALRVTPYLGDAPRGVFATRAPCRPNAIGMSLVRLIRRDGRVLHIEGVDVLDGTPLLDIKPHVPRFDCRPGARSGWLEEIDDETAGKRGVRGYDRAGDHTAGAGATEPTGGRDPSFTMLLSDRLTLRRFEPRDAEAFAAYRSDPDVARYQSWSSCSLDEARRLIASLGDVAPGAPGEWFQFAVSLTPTGPLVGDCALRCSDTVRGEGEIGFTFARTHQGKGLASEAVQRLLGYAFSTLELHRVVAIVDERNLPAQRLLEKLQFRREGQFVEAAWFKGSWVSEILYAMLREEWTGIAR